MSKSKILFIMTGSIACYKACQVISRLVQQGCEVQVVATASALQFVGAATLEGLTGKPVASDMYAAGSVMGHIHLARWADLVLVAPATANYINKIAQGVGDDLATTLFLAHDFKKPFLLAPAMNTTMYEHPITARNMKSLQELGVTLLQTAAGTLACGESGQGKLLDPDEILATTLNSLRTTSPTSNTEAPVRNSHQVPSGFPGVPGTLRILVTAGGTVENLDGVRVVTNLSSGGTGARLAESLSELGFEVTLLRADGAVAPVATFGIEQVLFSSFASLQGRIRGLLSEREFDVVIHAAAVSDYSVDTIEADGVRYSAQEFQQRKLPSNGSLSVHFKNNPKIVDEIKSVSRNPRVKLVAFKLTSRASERDQDLAVEKLFAHAPADLVVQNDTADIDKSKRRHGFKIYSRALAKTEVEGVPGLVVELSQFILKERL